MVPTAPETTKTTRFVQNDDDKVEYSRHDSKLMSSRPNSSDKKKQRHDKRKSIAFIEKTYLKESSPSTPDLIDDARYVLQSQPDEEDFSSGFAVPRARD